MITKDYPEEGELVIGTVAKVQNFGAFVKLDEYTGKEGFIHISEIATGWVKRIRNYVREKQKVVCKVLNVDAAKNHIDLSLKRVNEHQRRDKIQEWKNSQKAQKLFEMVAELINKDPTECYNEFGAQLAETYGTLYTAFEEAAYDKEALSEDGFQGDWVEAFNQVAEENISVSYVEIDGIITITCQEENGVEHIKSALNLAEQSEYEDVPIKVIYIGAPRYKITVEAPDYKIAEDQLKKALERATEHIKNHNGELSFSRDQDD